MVTYEKLWHTSSELHSNSAVALDRVLAASTLLLALVVLPSWVDAQEAENRTRTRVDSGAVQLEETFTLSEKRWSVGWTGDWRQGGIVDHSFSSRVEPTDSTKVVVHAAAAKDDAWEAKINQELGAFTLDLGAGSDDLFHSGIRFGARKGKGFGLAVSHVRSDRRRDSTALEAWHRIESVGLQAAVKHDARGLSWSVTKEALGAGALRFETLGADDGTDGSRQVIYGSRLREDARSPASGLTSEPLRLAAADDVFGPGAVEIDSPLFPDEEPLAWLVEDFGGRLQSIDNLGESRTIEVETVKYLSERVWIGGQYTLEDGATDGIDARFGSRGERIDLAASLGYRPRHQDVVGSVRLRWRPFGDG